ncbi:MAG: hypothetical protein QT01_C0008G0004 [archaeon GW2011_AR6]|nr:MAG: hypothetical protein QT01_C0008G0004 [archaeon GW2011_AR6]
MMGKNRPKGFWKDRENIMGELERVIQNLEHFPSHLELRKEKEWAILQGIRNYHGGRLLSFRDEMGYPPRDDKPAGFWLDFDNLDTELAQVITDLGHFPTITELGEIGKSSIINSIAYHGGVDEVKKKLGYETDNPYTRRREERIESLESKLDEPLETFLRREYEENHRAISNISAELESGEKSVSDWLKDFGIHVRTISEARRPKDFINPTKEELERMYVAEGKSSIKIGDELGVSNHHITRLMKEYGIPLRDPSHMASRSAESRIPTKEELDMKYIGEHKSKKELADEYKVTPTTIGDYLKKYGIPIRSASEQRLPAGFVEPSREQLNEWYNQEGKDSDAIAAMLGITRYKVKSLLQEKGVKKRRPSKFDPGKQQLEQWYLSDMISMNEIAERLGTVPQNVRPLLLRYDIQIRSIAETKLKGKERPSDEQLRTWYVAEGKTTTEISGIVGVADITISYWLVDAGVELRDKRGMYDNKSVREKAFAGILEITGKEPKMISTTDFQRKNKDGIGLSGLLGWYRRNYNVKAGTARDILLEDLLEIPIGESVFHNRTPLVRRKQLKEWDKYKAEIEKMFTDHPEIKMIFPSSTWLGENGYTYLEVYSKFHGGMNEVREKLGQSVLRRDSDSLRDFEYIRQELDIAIKNNPELNGNFPTTTWLYDHDFSYLANAAQRYHGGILSVKERMGYGKIKTESQLVDFLQENKEAGAIGDLAGITERTGDIADLLARLWPSRFPSAVQLSRSLPGAIKRIGHSLQPFSMDKARGFYDDVYAIPTEVKYVLDDIIYTIATDQYQLPFNKDPEGTLEELEKFASEKNGVSKLAHRVLDYYKQVYEFAIPGHGGLKEEI